MRLVENHSSHSGERTESRSEKRPFLTLSWHTYMGKQYLTRVIDDDQRRYDLDPYSLAA